jgi:hypothetical protein
VVPASAREEVAAGYGRIDSKRQTYGVRERKYFVSIAGYAVAA